jgi:hypothetical protein
MAEVDANVHDYVAHMVGVKAAVKVAAEERAELARVLLAQHRHQGHAKIVVVPTRGPDTLVALDDSRGQHAAMTIEFGRKPGGKNGAMEGLHVLGRAFGV